MRGADAGALRGAASGRRQARGAGARCGRRWACAGGAGRAGSRSWRRQGARDGPSAGGDGQQLLVAAQEACREGAQTVLAGAEHGGAELGKDLFGQIGVGQQPGRAAQARRGSRGAGRAPCLARRAGAKRGGRRGRSSSPGGGGSGCRDGRGRPGLGGAWSRGRLWPSGGTGGRRCRACRTRAGARPRVAGARPGRVWAASQKMASSLVRGSRMGRPAGRRSRKGGASGCWAASMAASRRVSISASAARKRKGARTRPFGVGERFPVPFGGVAAVVAEADHGAWSPVR